MSFDKKAYMAQWRAANRERIAAYQRAYMDGYYEANKDRIAAQQKNYRESNSEKIAARTKSSREKNPEAVAQRKREWAAKNSEHVKAKRRAQYAANRTENIAKAVAWNSTNKERRSAICAAYSSANPDQRRAAKARRRARANAAEGSYTKQDVKDILERQFWLCAVCRTTLTLGYEIDHVVPLARGGSNWPSNLQGLCMPCNRSKGAKDPAVFAAQRAGVP